MKRTQQKNSNTVLLAIKEFDNYHSLSGEQVKKIIISLPLRHIANLQSIVYSPTSEFNRLGMQVPISCQGAFYPDYRSVVIHQELPLEQFKHVLFHEIGHYVFHTIIGSYLKKEWVTKISRSQEYISDYARTNSSEDFSECYSFYAQKRFEKFSGVTPKLNFMRYKVFTP